MPSTTTTIIPANVGAGAKHLATLLEEVLARVVSSYASFNMELPTRRYFTAGDPVLDCEQVVVTYLQMYIGAPGNEASQPSRCSDPRSVTLNVIVSRAIPVVSVNGRPPAADAIQDAGVIVAYDSYILLDCAAQFDTWDASGYGMGVIATIDVRNGEGGLQSTVLTVTMAIP